MPPPTPTPSITISVTPVTITLGQSAVLSWSSTGVTTCTASGAWSGAQNPAGSTKVTPTTTGTFAYVLNCALSPAGSIAQSAVLTVNATDSVASARHAIPARRGARLLRTDLVADVAGTRALSTDESLSDPWGLVFAEKLPAVAASRLSDSSTSYDGAGSAQPTSAPLRLHLPAVAESAGFGAASVVANSSDGFAVSAAGRSAPARLLYAGTGGAIAGWSPEVEVGKALVVYAASDSAAYTALAIATSSTPSECRLYAADFRNGRIDVFDSTFHKQSATRTRFAFTDPALPPGYAPFGIAVIDELVYVAYAQRLVSSTDPVIGTGLGLIDVFTSSGEFITRLVAAGDALNAPWAMVRAPSDDALPFGRALLVGNTGDGRINAFDPQTGTLLGPLSDATGAALVVPSLHGLAFGNDYAGQPRTTLFFTAGVHGGAHGWYGRLDLVAPPEPGGR